MTDKPTLRIVASTNNERGDLFTRLTKDLFFALGYDDLRLNVHKSGRELDLTGRHRLEPRRVIAECKAQGRKSGGDDLNKFFGVLTRERKRAPEIAVAGYFVSIGGFSETSVEQELETDHERVILLGAQDVVHELQRSRVIVSSSDARVKCASYFAQSTGLECALASVELFGTDRGYIWCLCFGDAKIATHFSLIHADGTPLAARAANEIVAQDRELRALLSNLQYVAPPEISNVATSNEALERYRRWIGEEFGFIQLDGLPADTDLSATRLKLEQLFVPLNVIRSTDKDPDDEEQQEFPEFLPFGALLDASPHLAVLAMPGGGKSTLLKRVATSYAFRERRDQIADALPERDWLPLPLRCRELRDRAHRPILELLDDLPRHAAMSSTQCQVFTELVHEKLKQAQAILLIDGLDEISDEGARQAFANHLRTFIAMFPKAGVIITSREAGFRLVASVVADSCKKVTIAPLGQADVLSLTERWHVEIVGNSERVRTEARELGKAIWSNIGIRTLTQNPLLLTTLLVVKRCVGDLPRSRSMLYREAIRVLVRTWNVEGYEPLDEDETLAQLSYVACAMMADGKQQIGHKALLKLLASARRDLAAELQFTKISPREFIQRIEYRSSLLVQVGHAQIDGELQLIYEFRHLTFQEYLAARGYVEEQYPDRDSGRALADHLSPYFSEERWREVIALAAVLAGRKSEALMTCLVSRAREEFDAHGDRHESLVDLVYLCVRDEIQVAPATLKMLLVELARGMGIADGDRRRGMITTVLHGKFGELFQRIVEENYLAGADDFENYIPAMARCAVDSERFDDSVSMSIEARERLCRLLDSDIRLNRIRGAFVSMSAAYAQGELRRRGGILNDEHFFVPVFERLLALLSLDDIPASTGAAWAIAWHGDNKLVYNAPRANTVLALYRIWRKAYRLTEAARFVAWGLTAQPLADRDAVSAHEWGEDCDDFLKAVMDEPEPEPFLKRAGKQAAIIVAWYRRGPWTDIELAEQIKRIHDRWGPEPSMMSVLETLGDQGEQVLRYFKERSEGAKRRRKEKQ